MAQDYNSEIAKLLKLGQASPETLPPATHEIEPVVHTMPKLEKAGPRAILPNNLPVVDFDMEWNKPMADRVMEAIRGEAITQKGSALPLSFVSQPKVAKSVPKAVGWIKGLAFYPLVFVIAFAFFYVLLNFSSLVSQVSAWFAPSEEEQILQEDLTEFYTWINGYYFAVGNQNLLDPGNDIDQDGLTNLDEYKIRTNPVIADSDTDGMSDGNEVINATNPWGAGSMSAEQLKLVNGLDLIMINNRISFNTVNIADYLLKDPKNNYDLSKAGVLSIPRLSMQVPLIWTNDPKDFDADLTKGVVHYPGTALPGEKGIVYVSGHSSDYFWKHNQYKDVFARINGLQPGDDIFVDIYGVDGKVYNYRYKVTTKKVYKPDDQTQFIDNSSAKLNLSTCWPIGTVKDRLVVTSELVPL